MHVVQCSVHTPRHLTCTYGIAYFGMLVQNKFARRGSYISRRPSGASEARNDFSRNKIIFLANMESDVFSFCCCSFCLTPSVSFLCLTSIPTLPPFMSAHLLPFLSWLWICCACFYAAMLPLGVIHPFFPSFVRPSARGFIPAGSVQRN